MLAVTCVSQSDTDPLSGLEVGERPDPQAPDGWTTVRLRTTALNHHDIFSLRGIGLPADRLPMVLGCDGAGRRRRRQRGARARRGRLARVGRRRDARPAPQPAQRGARRHPGRGGGRAAPQPRAQAGGAVLGARRLPADRVADGLPDAVHQLRRAARRHRAGAGRRAAGSRRRWCSSAPRPASGCGSPAGMPPRASTRSRSAPTARSRAVPACPSGSTP